MARICPPRDLEMERMLTCATLPGLLYLRLKGRRLPTASDTFLVEIVFMPTFKLIATCCARCILIGRASLVRANQERDTTRIIVRPREDFWLMEARLSRQRVRTGFR